MTFLFHRRFSAQQLLFLQTTRFIRATEGKRLVPVFTAEDTNKLGSRVQRPFPIHRSTCSYVTGYTHNRIVCLYVMEKTSIDAKATVFNRRNLPLHIVTFRAK